jgi:hypothetical protein
MLLKNTEQRTTTPNNAQHAKQRQTTPNNTKQRLLRYRAAPEGSGPAILACV